MYAEKPLCFFLDKLCSNAPAPGGGSASALVGATAASLAGMLAALTVSNKKYESVKPQMQSSFERAARLKDELVDLLQKDTEAFDDAAVAFKLPKNTEEEKKKRDEAVEKGLKKATEVPLAVMEKSLEVAHIALDAVKKGNEMAITDGALSALFAETAAAGGMMNVLINLGWMKNEDYIRSTKKRIESLLEEIGKIREEAVSYTMKKLKH